VYRSDLKVGLQTPKKLLPIKSFIGTSENLVKIQIWTALITILMLKALSAPSKYAGYVSNLKAFISLPLLTKINLQEWLDQPLEKLSRDTTNPNIRSSLFKN